MPDRHLGLDALSEAIHPSAAAVPRKPARPHSVRHEHRSHGDVREDVAGDPTEEQLAHAAVRIGAHHQHADSGLNNHVLLAGTPACDRFIEEATDFVATHAC
jgi:hypothetical protein